VNFEPTETDEDDEPTSTTGDAMTEGRAPEIRDWTGSVFDPEVIRHFSILPDEEDDEAYCVRHDREMRAVDPVVHKRGALYTTAENFSVYTCPSCVAELHLVAPAHVEKGGVTAYRGELRRAFDWWDRGVAAGDWFQYLREGSPDDIEELGAISRPGGER